MSWLLFDTPIGACGVAWNVAGLAAFQLPEVDDDATRARLGARASARGPMSTTPPTWLEAAMVRARAHLAGTPQDLTLVPLDLSRVTPFNAKVLRAAQDIPAGRTMTYGELAVRVGSPGASRAVGRAMATNPWPLIVPCHRVVGASGAAGGFSAHGGLVTKERILQLEGATLLTGAAAAQMALFDE